MSIPPPPTKIPKKILDDPELRAFFEPLLRSNYLVWSGIEKFVGFYGTGPVTQGAALTTNLTSITHTSPGTPDYAIQDLSNAGGPYGFVTKDEGNTVLSVILNLQTRVDELEARLDSSTGVGLIT